MHRAPAVSFPVVRSGGHAQVLAVIWLAGTAAIGLLHLTQSVPVYQSVICLLVSMVCGWVGWMGWWRAGTGRLQWDGQHWAWSGFTEGDPCRVAMHLDFQSLVLISVTTAQGQRQWLWLQSAVDGAHWSALRRALVAPDAPDAPGSNGEGIQPRTGLLDL